MKQFFILFVLLIAFTGIAQSPIKFHDEVELIQKKYGSLSDSSKETIVFTGSSSIRMWRDLQDRFPDYLIVNSGFGGSQASDLLHYSYDLILRYQPKKVFIYEGDNDIFAKKKPNDIIYTTERIIYRIQKNFPDAQIILISAKPSIARWDLKRKYKKLNRKFERMARKDDLLAYADVWNPMLEGRNVRQDIFVEDGLHMNAKGYEIWFGVMKEFL